MEPEQAKKLGAVLRGARNNKGYSAVKLGELTDMNDATIIRLENGGIASPAPDKLTRIAEALDLRSADVFALADYTAPTDLPSMSPYLRTKYKDLPPEAAAKIENYTRKIAKQHGISIDGPAPGEDETH
ncbi:MAG: helix-turn-helix transcriptional regulator [Acidimicrobiales bacterium]